MLLVKWLSFIIAVDTMNCLKDVCDKDCISDVILFNKKNLSMPKDLFHNITVHSSVFDNAMKYDDWSQVISENETSEAEESSHRVVPGISNYERGT